jgi:hypothetical protein
MQVTEVSNVFEQFKEEVIEMTIDGADMIVRKGLYDDPDRKDTELTVFDLVMERYINIETNSIKSFAINKKNYSVKL